MKTSPSAAATIGSRIRTAREEKGLSQMDLAKALEFQSGTAISLIENDERGVSAEALQKFSLVLRRSVNYFLTGRDEVKTNDVFLALRADKDLTEKDKNAIEHFIELFKNKRHGR